MITPDMNTGGGSRSASDIESDIRRTRGRMDATLDQLGDRLTARSVLHTILDIWESRQPSTPEGEVRTKRVYGALTKQVSHQIRENPIPTLLIGAGIAWMFMDRDHDVDEREYVEMSGRRYRVRPAGTSGVVGGAAGVPVTEYEYEEVEYDDIDQGPGMMDRAKEKLAQGKEAIADAASAAKDRITGIGSSARHRASDVGHSAHDVADQVRDQARDLYSRGASRGRAINEGLQEGYRGGAERFTEAVHETPLAVGLGFAALGALVGLLLPHTRREDELMGQQSDELLDTVKDKAKETFEKGKLVAERVAETALDEAQKHGLTVEAASEKLSGLAGTAAEIAQKVKDEATAAAQEQHLVPGQSGGGGQPAPQTPSYAGTTGSAGVTTTEESVVMPPRSGGCGC